MTARIDGQFLKITMGTLAGDRFAMVSPTYLDFPLPEYWRILMTKQSMSLIGPRADRILGVTAAAFAATTASGVVGTTQYADAEIIDSGVVNVDIPDDFSGVYLNLVDGASGAAPPAGWDVNPYSAAVGTFNLWSFDTTTWLDDGAGVFVHALGTTVDAAGLYGRPGGGTDVGLQVTLNAANYFGVQFNNEDTGTVNYGWMEITFGATASERAFTRWAYQDDGTGIDVGQLSAIPEPASASLLALGAIGLMVRRRRTA